MRINDDLTKTTIVHGDLLDWVPSPAKGVERRMLYREGNEVARATSIVRYAPGSAFPRHVHDGGEEILVLEGTFQDEHGDYPAGSYFRNPPGTSHVPAAAMGCTIFVRLWQYRNDDKRQVVRQPGEGQAIAPRQGAAQARLLFDDEAERITLEDWGPEADLALKNKRGLECLVLSGQIKVDGETMRPQSWLRYPDGKPVTGRVGPEGARLWVRDAPLRHANIIQMVKSVADLNDAGWPDLRRF